MSHATHSVCVKEVCCSKTEQWHVIFLVFTGIICLPPKLVKHYIYCPLETMLSSSNDCSLWACQKVQCVSSQHVDVTHTQLKLAPIPSTSPTPCPSPRDIQDHPSASQIINSHSIGQHFVNRVHSYFRKKGEKNHFQSQTQQNEKKHLLAVPEDVWVFGPFTSLQTVHLL